MALWTIGPPARARPPRCERFNRYRASAVDRLEEGHGISGTALIAQQPGEARGGGQFPGEGALAARPVERLPEVILGHHRGFGRALQQKQLAFDAQQLGNRPAFFGALRACVRLRDRFITVCQPCEVYSSRAGHGVCWQWRSGARTLRRWHWPAEQAPKADDPLACVRSALTSARNSRR